MTYIARAEAKVAEMVQRMDTDTRDHHNEEHTPLKIGIDNDDSMDL